MTKRAQADVVKREAEGICPGCGCAVEFTQVMVGGHWFPAKEACTACTAREEVEAASRPFEAWWAQTCPAEMRESDPDHAGIDSAAFKRALRWPRERSLVLTGANQLGKTRAFWQLVRLLSVEDRRRVSVFIPGEFERALQMAMDERRFPAWYESLTSADVVAIDDLGKEKMTERVETTLFNLLNHRLDHGRLCLLTANRLDNPQKVAAKFYDSERGMALILRLSNRCHVLVFGSGNGKASI